MTYRSKMDANLVRPSCMQFYQKKGVFVNAGATLISSTAAAIEFLIQIVPWLPIIVAGLWLGRWLWSKRKKSA